MQYACTMAGVDHKFTDVSCLAIDKAPGPVPFSLGFRSQALPLKRVSARTKGRFIRPEAFKECMSKLASRPGSGKNAAKALITEDIGETFSLIYAPFYMETDRIFDGVLKKPIGSLSLSEEELDQLSNCRPEKETQILPGVCPGCGWDLEGQSDSLALVCRNCNTLWQPRGKQLGKIKFGSAKPDSPEDVLIPFWRISAKVEGLPLASRGDVIRLANLPGGPKSWQDGDEFYFWAPAFKIRPKVFLRAARQLTIGQPNPVLEKTIRKNVHLPITLPATEAIQSIKIIVASMARPLKDILPQVAQAKIKAVSVTLVFMPFESHAHEFIHRNLNLALNTNVVKLSGNL
ncbi:MAG: hypothetical protein MI892_12605 [Desulfobacterales bacterium]|nr:hypothetical protein [Desulfobacterales bacterium]